MSTRKCTNCNCPCLLVSVGCIKDQLNPFTPMTPEKRVRAAIDLATNRYIRPILTEPCFTAICAALDLSELPTGDENYEALPAHYQTFIDTYAIPLISEAATAFYIDNYGDDQIAITFEDEEAKQNYIKRKFAGAAAAKTDFKTWYEKDTTKAKFTCLPEESTEVCIENKVGLSTEFGDFAASTKYPSNLRPK